MITRTRKKNPITAQMATASSTVQRKSGVRKKQSAIGPVSSILFLQRTIGNRAVGQLLQSGTLQSKLSIGQPGDQYEREADSVATKVVSMPEPTVQSTEDEENALQTAPLAANITRLVQTAPIEEEQLQQVSATEEEEAQPLQRQAEEEDKTIQEKTLLQKQALGEEEEPVQEKVMLQEQGLEDEEQNLQEKTVLQKQGLEDEEKLQEKSGGNSSGQKSQNALSHIEGEIAAGRGNGRPLSDNDRSYFESRFGTGFGGVRLHTDTKAAQMSAELNARAFTIGKDVYFGSGRFDTGSSSGKKLLAHELTHVVQQNGTSGKRSSQHDNTVKNIRQHTATSYATIQRRLFVSGAVEAQVREYLTCIGTIAGLLLQWVFRNPRVRIRGNRPGAIPSRSARRMLRTIINNPRQHAEIHIGSGQPGIGIGAFPGAGSMIQNIDIDDIRNLNAQQPNHGSAKAYHETVENYHHHGTGTPGFAASHREGLEAESNVLEDVGIAGRRLPIDSAVAILPPAGMPAGTYVRVTQTFTHYFLVLTYRVNPGNNWELVATTRTPKIQVSQRSIERFRSGGTAVPAGGAAHLASTLADLTTNANSTLCIEGYADSVGRRSSNRRLSRNRAASARAWFIAQGINNRRIAIVGRGETNPIAPNNTTAGRARNRRIVLTVHRP